MHRVTGEFTAVSTHMHFIQKKAGVQKGRGAGLTVVSIVNV